MLKLWDAGKKNKGGDPANAGAGEATAPSERWGDNLFFCRRWDPQTDLFFYMSRNSS